MPNKWLFSHQEISRSPSITCGRIDSVGAEAVLRAKAARFVFDCGAELLLPQYTISSACIYLHRFYMRRSLMEHHSYVRVHHRCLQTNAITRTLLQRVFTCHARFMNRYGKQKISLFGSHGLPERIRICDLQKEAKNIKGGTKSF
eukprot:Partr_v1_DN28048_c3_g1_i3_m56708